jgi:formylglycine-generating enzyme required for sulfatase activity
LTQVLCSQIVDQQNQRSKSFVSLVDIEDAAKTLVRAGHAHFDYLFQELDPLHAMLLSGMAAWFESRAVLAADLGGRLRSFGLNPNELDLPKQLQQLAALGYLLPQSGTAEPSYKFRLLLVRFWLSANRPFDQAYRSYLASKQTTVQVRSGSQGTLTVLKLKMDPPQVVEKDGMVWIPPGPFLAGINAESAVLEQGCWMDKFPVTNAEFVAFLDSGSKIDPHWFSDEKRIRAPQFARHPVVRVSWYGARAYAMWAGKRLPTELEWEKAARGVDGRMYPWGDQFDSGRCNTREAGLSGTSQVDAYPTGVSPYGCWDMAGNVWEWMENDYTNRRTSLRGGSRSNGSSVARCANRIVLDSENRFDNIGFRCSRTMPLMKS